MSGTDEPRRFTAVIYNTTTRPFEYLITAPENLKGLVIVVLNPSEVPIILGYAESLESPMRALTEKERALYTMLCNCYLQGRHSEDV